jgi:hypothetical protein
VGEQGNGHWGLSQGDGDEVAGVIRRPADVKFMLWVLSAKRFQK